MEDSQTRWVDPPPLTRARTILLYHSAQSGISRSFCAETRSTHSASSIQYRLMTDRQPATACASLGSVKIDHLNTYQSRLILKAAGGQAPYARAGVDLKVGYTNRSTDCVLKCFVYTVTAYCNRGITAKDMEKSQHTDFNKDTTNESASVAYSSIRL